MSLNFNTMTLDFNTMTLDFNTMISSKFRTMTPNFNTMTPSKFKTMTPESRANKYTINSTELEERKFPILSDPVVIILNWTISTLNTLKSRNINLIKGDILFVRHSEYHWNYYIYEGDNLVNLYSREKCLYTIPRKCNIFNGFHLRYWDKIIDVHQSEIKNDLHDKLYMKQLIDNLVFDKMTLHEQSCYKTSFLIPDREQCIDKISSSITEHLISDLSNIILEYCLSHHKYHIFIIEAYYCKFTGSDTEYKKIVNEIKNSSDILDELRFNNNYNDSFKVPEEMKDCFYIFINTLQLG